MTTRHRVPTTPQEWTGLVPLGLLLEHVAPAYGGPTWEQACADLLAWPGEADVVADLAAAVGPDGVFTEPVRVDWYLDPDDDTDYDDPDCGWERPAPDPLGRRFRVGNGMHRITAARAAGFGRVRVTGTPEPATDGPDDPTEYVEVVFTVDADTWPTAAHDEQDPDDLDDIDFAASHLRSFPLPDDGTWVESVMLAGHGTVLTALYECAHDHLDQLLAVMAERCNRYGVQLTVVSTRTPTGADLWADDEEPAHG